ncbi:SAGA HAT/Core module component [Lambiella insularis]|nr:SAGA HAT/Core module component [Lambiella insularis]
MPPKNKNTNKKARGQRSSKATPEQPKKSPDAGASTRRRTAQLSPAQSQFQTVEELFQNISVDAKDVTLAQLTANSQNPSPGNPPTVPQNMAARNRPRNGGQKEDPDEEMAMWKAIERDIQKCTAIQKKQQEVSEKIKTMDAELARKLSPTVAELDAFSALHRELLKLSEDEYRMLNEEPANLIKNTVILRALCTASGQEPDRVLQPTKSRTKPKPPKPDLDGAADSPGPSPSVATSSTSRLKGTSTARSGSVASVRDEKEKVKVEEGAEGIKGPAAERGGKFYVGAEVAYKQAKQREDGSQWIQCQIVGIQDLGNNKKRYEVRDPEPDEGGPAQNYKAYASVLIAIPPADAVLPDYPEGKHVLAKYPDTTAFYRAVVMGKTEQGLCRLKFEDDQNQEMAMDRRFVLDANNK